MSVMTEEKPGQAIRRPASGISIDPYRLTWYREDKPWSRQDLSDAVARLELLDEAGEPLTVTRDAIAKIENGERKPKARTIRALCQALGVTVRDLMPGGVPLAPHDDAEERRLRLAHNRDLRDFARAHGIRYRNPVSGRVYYSVPLKDAFDASVAGAAEDELIRLIALARESAAAEPSGQPEQDALPGSDIDAGDGIGILDLSVRTHNSLIRTDIRTIADLTRTHADELLGLRGFGAASLDEIREKLDGTGFALAGEGDRPDPELLAS